MRAASRLHCSNGGPLPATWTLLAVHVMANPLSGPAILNAAALTSKRS